MPKTETSSIRRISELVWVVRNYGIRFYEHPTDKEYNVPSANQRASERARGTQAIRKFAIRVRGTQAIRKFAIRGKAITQPRKFRNS